MPWIDNNHRLHECDLPEWYEYDEVMPSDSQWGCPDCGRVYQMLLGSRSIYGEKERTPLYIWERVESLIYVDEG